MSPAPAKMNPFPGLRSFTQEEDYLFFGREEQTLELLQRLSSNRFVAVVGSSGSGKSSLVRCGLLSELLGGRMLEAGASWEIAVTHPGGNPLALLTDALLEADLYDREQPHARENLLATLSRSHFGLVEAVKQAGLAEGTNFLLVVDQFEEVFRFHEAGQTQQEAANEFVSLLLEAAAQKEVPIYVVLTMRSDFIGECGQFEGLAEMVNRGEFLIPRLNREQYKRVIEGPIKVAGGQIAPRLLQRLLNDLGQQADQLPCLQHALMRTWDVWAANGGGEAIDLDDYQRVGKMSQALSLHADEVYESLASNRQRDLCRGVFQALTVEEANSRGIRRPQRLGRLCQILEVPADDLRPIIDAYRRSGVTFLMPPAEVELTDQTIIDISHESLMRVWTRLRLWVEEETQAAGIYHRLSESADLHQRGKAGLYRDPELGIALAWRESNRPNAAWAERYRPGFATAMAFLEASQQASAAEEQARESLRQRELAQAQQLAEAQQLRLEQQQRSARGLRQLIVGLAIVAIVAIVACVAALLSNRRANDLAALARQKTAIAEASAADADRERKGALQAQKATATALAQVESQKSAVESSLTKAEQAEEAGRKLLYTTDMRLAPFVWGDDRTTAQKLRTLLAKHIPAVPVGGNGDQPPAAKRPDLRGFEWHYFQHLLESSADVFSGHETSVISGAFTANGQLVTLDQNGQARRWDLNSRVEEAASRRDLLSRGSEAIRVLSPDGRFAALAKVDKVQVFDTSTGQETFQVDSANDRARRLIFTPDGNRPVIVDDKIRWYRSASGQAIASLNQKFNRGSTLAISADGLTLAVVGHGSLGNHFSVFRLDAATQKLTPLGREVEHGGTLDAAALSSDGRLIAVGKKLSGTVTIVDTATGLPVAEHNSAHTSRISAMTFAGDGFQLVTADVEGTIKIWDDARKLTSKSAASTTLKGHEGAITHVGFSAAGTQLVSTSADKTARVWDMQRTGPAIRVLDRSGNGCYAARFSPDGLLIAAADGNSVRLWDAATGRLVRELSAGDEGRVYSVAFSPTDSRVLAVGYGGKIDLSHVVLWDIDTGTELSRLTGATDLPDFPLDDEYSGAVGALAFSPDGKHLVAGFGSPNLFSPAREPTPLKVWEVASRRLIRRLSGHLGYCVALDFSPDGSRLASGSRDGTAILWSTKTWKATQTLVNPELDSSFGEAARGMIDDVAFSPDGKTLATASREGSVHLWDAATGQLLDSLRGHSSAVNAVVFSPDGRTLASGGGDQTVRLWNVETRRELMQLDSGNVELGGVETLAFSPDGTRLLAGGQITAFWSATPVIWNEPARAAQKLQLLRQSTADFPSRIRMFSENLRLHEALAKLDPQDNRVPAALAATEANWQASRGASPEAVAAFDRLLAADPVTPQNWLRTPGLLRLATSLLQQNRPVEAAALLSGGAKRRSADGLPAAVDRAGLGVTFSLADGQVQVAELLTGFPAARSDLRPGDVILKINDIELTRESLQNLSSLLAGNAGTQVRLTIRRPGSDQPQVIELTREQFVHDAATGELLHPLRAAINARLAAEPGHPGLLELRAELAGQWSDPKAQVADYTAAIHSLTAQTTKDAAANLRRLYARRGTAHVALKQWPEAVADFAQVITPETTDEELLANQALALAEATPVSEKWTVLKPAEMTSAGGATLTLLEDDSILVGGENPPTDVYTLTLGALPAGIQALRLEVLPHESLPQSGPGRNPSGKFVLTTFKAEVDRPSNAAGPQILKWAKAWADYSDPDGNIALAIDMDDNTGWANQGDVGEQHFAVFEFERPVAASDAVTLRVSLEFKHASGQTGLGRFRLSAIGDPLLLNQVKKRFAARELSDPWQKLAVVYQLEGQQQAIDQLIERRPQLAGQIGAVFSQNEDWSRAVEIFSRGITPATTDVELLSKRARAYEGLKNWEAAAADWTRATTGNPNGAKLLADFALRLATVEQLPLARTVRQDAQEMLEQALQADSGDPIVAEQLAELLLDASPTDSARLGSVSDPWLRLAVGYALHGETEPATNYFAAALDAAPGMEAEQPIVGVASRFESILATLHEQRPNDSLLQLALARNLAKQGLKSLAEERPADAQRELEKSRDLFTRLLADHPKTEWVVATVESVQSANGATLNKQADGSILASGDNPDQDTYTLRLQSVLPQATAIRLETLPDDSLLDRGSGRSGNFNLTGITIQRDSPGPAGSGEPIKIQSAWVDYSDRDSGGARDGTEGIIDASDQTHWSVHPLQHQAHEAIMQLAKAIDLSGGATLTVQLHFQQKINLRHAIGHFRLSLSSDTKAVSTANLYTGPIRRELAEVHAALGKALALLGHRDGAAASFTQAFALGDERQPQPRSIAARAAALTAAGKIQDDSPLDDAAKAKLRSLALECLRANLSDWNKLLDAAPSQDLLTPDRLMIVNAISRWQRDNELAGIRDAESLARLPAAEQQAFAQLWADAAALLMKADGGFRALPASQQVAEVRKELQKRNRLFSGTLTPVIENDAVTGLKFNVDRVLDVAPVSALLHLKFLEVRGTFPDKGLLSDLSPLQGMALDHLDCESTQVSDLTALRGMPLTRLSCGHTPVSDLTPLQGMALEELGIAGTSVSDLSPIKGMPLKNLMAMNMSAKDLTPLLGMPLTSLDLHGTTGVTNLQPLERMPLTYLNLTSLPISDLSALQGMTALKIADLKQTRVTDANLAQLQDCPNLTTLTLTGTKVTAAGVEEMKRALPKCKIEWAGAIDPR